MPDPSPSAAPPRRNIELKARLRSLADTEAAVRALPGVQDLGLLRQCDTYFVVPHGRLKLRQTTGKPAELIQYHRPDHTAERASDYRLVPAPDPAALIAALSASCGLRGQVRKTRHLYMWHNVRIHLDQVEGLGDFLEFEAVLSHIDDEPTSLARLTDLTQKLSLPEEDRLSHSYSDLLNL